jgi:hypothetical protein
MKPSIILVRTAIALMLLLTARFLEAYEYGQAIICIFITFVLCLADVQIEIIYEQKNKLNK